MDIPFMQLLEYGLPGFAVILLTLGFRLLSSFQKEMIQVDVEKFHDSPEMFSTWTQMMKSQAVNARIFMGVSTLFFAGGMVIAIVVPENRIIVSVAPAEGTLPVVTLQENRVQLDDLGKALLVVKDDQVVRVRNNALINAINERTRERDDLRSALRNYISKFEGESKEAGF
jgi:hypothetical protein